MRRSARIRERSTPIEQQSRYDSVDSGRVRDRLAHLNKNILLRITNKLKHDPAANIGHVLTSTARQYAKKRDWYTKITLNCR